MAETQVRVGIIGCGVHAREVLLPAAQQAGMEFAAVCDLDRRLAQRVSRRFGAFRAYQDIRSMIDEMDLDAVLVCGPPEMHAEAAAIALQHRCHLWTEMPAAPTAEEAERLAGLADAQGLIAQPGLMLRYAPACMRLRELVAGEEFGAIRQIEVAWWPPEQHAHDDAPLFERFFFVSSASPLDVRAVRAAAERLAADPARAERDGLALDPKALQISFTVKKESGR